MAPPHKPKRRAVLDFSRSQAGDVATGDNAGGNIEHYGYSATELGDLLEQMQQWRAKDRAYESDRLGMDLRLRERDAQDRELQRALLNSRLDVMSRQLATLPTLRWWLAGLTLAFVIVAAVLLWLVVDRAAVAGLARTVFDLAIQGSSRD